MQCVEVTKSFTLLVYTDSISNFSNSINSPFSQSFSQESDEVTQCVWRRSDTTASEFFIYGFVVPMLALFGLCANFINFIVFLRPKMTPSAFSYLAALSCLDCISCFLIALTSFSRSFLYESTLWLAYDFQLHTPLFGTATGAANLILACVSLDRFIYLRWGIMNGTPKFCKRAVARKLIMAVIVLSILINMPYFWVFVVNDDGTFKATKFYFSKYYRIHNWVTFILLTVLPAIFLMVGNTAILIAFCKWTKNSKKCQSNCSNTNNKHLQNRYKHQMKLTITIVIVITLYLVGELPAHLTSRKSVVNLLYGGDITKVNLEIMQRLELICITLNALQLSMNIIIYGVINPSFIPEFFDCLKEASDMCLRVLGFMSIANCWLKLLSSIHKKKKHTSSECINEDNDNQEHGIGNIQWDVSETNENTFNASIIIKKSVTQKLDVSVICIANPKRSFDNPSFEFEK